MRILPLEPLLFDSSAPLPVALKPRPRAADVDAWPDRMLATALQLPRTGSTEGAHPLQQVMGHPGDDKGTREMASPFDSIRESVLHREVARVLADPEAVGSGALVRSSRWLPMRQFHGVVVAPLAARWESRLAQGEVGPDDIKRLAEATFDDLTHLLPLLAAWTRTGRAISPAVLETLIDWTARATETPGMTYRRPPGGTVGALEARWAWAGPKESWEPQAAHVVDQWLVGEIRTQTAANPRLTNNATLRAAIWGRCQVLFSISPVAARLATLDWITKLASDPHWGAIVTDIVNSRRLTEILKQDSCPPEIWDAIANGTGPISELVAPNRWRMDKLTLDIMGRLVDRKPSRWWEAVDAWRRGPRQGDSPQMLRWLNARPQVPSLTPTQWLDLATSNTPPFPQWVRNHLPLEVVRQWGPAEWKRLLMHPQQELRLWGIQLQGQVAPAVSDLAPGGTAVTPDTETSRPLDGADRGQASAAGASAEALTGRPAEAPALLPASQTPPKTGRRSGRTR